MSNYYYNLIDLMKDVKILNSQNCNFDVYYLIFVMFLSYFRYLTKMNYITTVSIYHSFVIFFKHFRDCTVTTTIVVLRFCN